jgi:small subunit ribosomal protein S8
MTDPISDYLTRIRNAQQAGHRFVEIPASKLKKRITELLYDKGYILKYKFEDIISTSKGVITDKEARDLGVGCEVLCEVF